MKVPVLHRRRIHSILYHFLHILMVIPGKQILRNVHQGKTSIILEKLKIITFTETVLNEIPPICILL